MNVNRKRRGLKLKVFWEEEENDEKPWGVTEAQSEKEGEYGEEQRR